MTIYRKDIDYQSLFRKLGHNLEEIRVRSLENIASKLEHQLICEQDIIHERHLIIRLLEWFNFSPCPKKEEVLHLLCRLTKHCGAAELLHDIGGMEFLTLLRADVDANLQPVIDQILENVLHLPDAPIEEHAPECIYHKPTDSALLGPSLSSMRAEGLSFISTTASSCRASIPCLATGESKLSDNVNVGYFGSSDNGCSIPAPSASFSAAFLQNCGGGESQGTTTHLKTGWEPFLSGNGFKMSTFPWVVLTMTDRQVIQSTEGSLCSKDHTVINSACEFLSEVVFLDFPAEVFIQRPKIFRRLLALVGCGREGNLNKKNCATRTLCDLCKWLQNRIRYFQDPALYTASRDFGVSPSSFSFPMPQHEKSAIVLDGRSVAVESRSRQPFSAFGRNDFIESAESSSMDDTDAGEASSLLLSQSTLLQFAAISMLQSLKALLQSIDEESDTELFKLAFEAWNVLATVLHNDIWTSGSASAGELVLELKKCLLLCGELLDYRHHHRCNSSTQATERCSVVRNRRVYLGVATLLSNMLQLLPRENVIALIPDQLYACLGQAIFDESLALCLPRCHSVFMHFTDLLGIQAFRDIQHVLTFRRSMVDTCNFILNCKDINSQLFSYDAALKRVSRGSEGKAAVTRGQCVLLKLFSHPTLQIRHHTYTTVLSTVQSCLNAEKQAVNPSYTGYLDAAFLLDSDIMYEVVCFGLADPNNKVSAIARELLFYLLQCQLLLGDLLWSELMSALLRSLPILESYSDLKTRFGRRVWGILDPSTSSDNLCLLEKLRGCLRLMLSTDPGLREEAVKRLLWFLVNESGHKEQIIELKNLNIEQFSSFLIVDCPNYLDLDSDRSVFQPDGVKQVLDIFTTDDVDFGVKKSAADQLAIMLQDPHLHGTFRQYGGLEIILSTLHQVKSIAFATGTQAVLPLISDGSLTPACVIMLRHLLLHDYSLRHRLCHDPTIYYDLLRACFSMYRDENVSYNVSIIFTLLLFDEVSKFDISSNSRDDLELSFSLPAIITKRYRLPFHPTVHHTTSPNAILGPPVNDFLLTALPQEMLRTAWNVAWCGGLDRLLEFMDSKKLHLLKEFSQAMYLTDIDKTVVKATCLQHGLKEGIQAMCNATCHDQVLSALHRVAAIVATNPLQECTRLLHQLSWTDALDRFLRLIPSSPEDEHLLTEVLLFTISVLKLSPRLKDGVASRLFQRLSDPAGPLVAALSKPLAEDDPTGKAVGSTASWVLDKVCLLCVTTMLSRVPYRPDVRVTEWQARGDFIYRLLARLNISATPNFCNLASIEATLVCLMHLTARPGWSLECSEMDAATLRLYVLKCLQQVVSTFHTGRGGTTLSYMGKGVTKAACFTLMHLAHEMNLSGKSQNWMDQWLFYDDIEGCDVNEHGLDWMLTLWAYRDAEIRSAGLGIAVALTLTENGCSMVCKNCSHVSDGVWGSAMAILGNESECSMVRYQATLLLQNLTSQPISNIIVNKQFSPLCTEPAVTNLHLEVSPSGVDAVHAVIHHYGFYGQLSKMLSFFVSSPILQPVLVTTEIHLHSTDDTHPTSSSCEYSKFSDPRHFGLTVKQRLELDDTYTGQNARQMGGASFSGDIRDSQSHCSTNNATVIHQGCVRLSDDVEKGVRSVVTPCLVAAVSQLLRNLAVLAPADTFSNLTNHSILGDLIRLVDMSLLVDLCHQGTSGDYQAGSLVFFCDLLWMYTSIISLLSVTVKVHSPARSKFLADKSAMSAIVSTLLLHCDSDGDFVYECRRLWIAALDFMCCLLLTQGAATLSSLTLALSRDICTDVFGALTHQLEIQSDENRVLCASITSFLSLMLAEEGRRTARESCLLEDSTTLSELLDQCKVQTKFSVNDVHKMDHFTIGASLSNVLVRSYELKGNASVLGRSKTGRDALQIINALKSLFAVSISAKRMALDMGFVEILLDVVKETHARLSLDSLTVLAPSKQKDGPLQELVLSLNLLRNILYDNVDAKVAAAESGLAGVMYQLWPWCLQESTLMTAALSMLVNYTANCPTAAASMSTNSNPSPASTPYQQQHHTSFISAIVKFTRRELDKEPSTSAASPIKPLFALLTSLSLSSECRKLICKSNLLQGVSSLSVSRSRKSHKRHSLDALWWKFALALSFSTDSQQQMLNNDDFLTTVLHFLENGFWSPACQQSVVMVLRNMCCHGPNKHKILANDRVIPSLVNLVESADNSAVQILAASALACLAFNNHKAKMAMRSENVVPRMNVVRKELHGDRLGSGVTRLSEIITDIVSAVGN